MLGLIQEAAERGLLPSRVSHRLQQRQHRATESPTIRLTAVSAGAAAATFSGGTTGPAVLSKRTRDQTEGDTQAVDAADADAPSSKLRRLEHSSSKAAAPAAATADAADAAKPEAATAADAVEPMDTSAAADSSQQQPEDVRLAVKQEAPETQDSNNEQAAGASAENPAPAAPAAAAAEPQARASSPQHPVQATEEAAAAGADTPALTDMVGRSVEVLLLVHGLSKRVLGKAVTLKKEAIDANSKAEQVAALASSNQQLQLQNKLLQQQVRVAEAELLARQQQLQQVQIRAQHAVVAYPQLIARVTNSVNRLVAAASQESLPVGDRQELARISQELLAACGQL